MLCGDLWMLMAQGSCAEGWGSRNWFVWGGANKQANAAQKPSLLRTPFGLVGEESEECFREG